MVSSTRGKSDSLWQLCWDLYVAEISYRQHDVFNAVGSRVVAYLCGNLKDNILLGVSEKCLQMKIEAVGIWRDWSQSQALFDQLIGIDG